MIPSTDEEFKLAIQALKSSTKAIERRTRTLHAQDAHLKHLRAVEEAGNARKARQEQYLDQKYAAKVQHVKFANEQIFEALRSDLRAESDRTAKDVKSAPAMVTGLLNSDDRVLSEINDLLSSGIQQECPINLDALTDRVNRLTRALQYFRAKTVKDRLDRTYLESLGGTDTASNAQAVAGGTVDAVREDLGSLYSEIDDVVGMVVAQEHGNALHAALQSVRRVRKQDNRRLNEEVYAKLCSLTETLVNVSKKLENLQSRRLSLHEFDMQLKCFETSARSNAKPVIVPAGAEPKDTVAPAALTLVQHLGLSSGSSDSKISDISAVRGQLDNLTSTLSCQSAGNILRILQLSEQAAAKGRVAVRRASDAVASHDSHEIDVRELEGMIAAAKAEMERVIT
ncbi:uncharacterized protein Z519_01011 [Cladophialophora bantiana CBS 173.52]|uniref:Uncharacterized protein n=1 Tax=Cladophialophora bantiana (strain ATCC 10958 / CBS 173.52 / CDC B-1940 / NIH 8579) TaxID=1442370 RepID=A0A0D2GGF1_CLAB1|nr:uncharacterized protein Z519_01011 [Cladophialophora bantiana CBS 173.52]KIW97427.1 hypothetical protein Z519_01011 [Cladophialophora bantiana CBS 173.52]